MSGDESPPSSPGEIPFDLGASGGSDIAADKDRMLDEAHRQARHVAQSRIEAEDQAWLDSMSGLFPEE